MARIRSIKPQIWSSADFCSLSIHARLLWIGLWNFADDHGRGDARPKQIKIQVFPADEEITEEILVRLLLELDESDVGFDLYEVDGKPYFSIPEKSWEHQKINRPQSPKFPERSVNSPKPFTERSVSAHGSFTERSLNENISSNNSQPIEIIEEKPIHGSFTDHSVNVQCSFTPDRIGKDRIGKDRIGEEGSARARAREAPVTNIQYSEDTQEDCTLQVDWFQCGKIFGEVRKRYGHGGYATVGFSKDTDPLSRVAAWANGDAGEWTAAQLVELSAAGFIVAADDRVKSAKYHPGFWWTDAGAHLADGLAELKRWEKAILEGKINAIRESKRRDPEAVREIESLVEERERIDEAIGKIA